MEPVDLVVTLTIKAADRDDFIQAAHDFMLRARREPANRHISVAESPDTPGRFVVCEGYRDREEFTEKVIHLDWVVSYMASIEPMFAAPREVQVLDAIDL
jgi:quinol monooxygenase YgiN